MLSPVYHCNGVYQMLANKLLIDIRIKRKYFLQI